jgi:hypothetical protein
MKADKEFYLAEVKQANPSLNLREISTDNSSETLEKFKKRVDEVVDLARVRVEASKPVAPVLTPLQQEAKNRGLVTVDDGQLTQAIKEDILAKHHNFKKHIIDKYEVYYKS